MTTPADVRRLFPALEKLTWLNAAASSPLCRPVAEAMQAFGTETTAQGDLGFGRWLHEKERLRARLARMVQCAPESLALTPSTSFGFNIAAQMLWARGIRRVVSVSTEFPSTTVPFLHQGMTLEVISSAADGSYQTEQLLAAASRPQTAIAISVVQFASGYRLDIDTIAAHCRAKSIPLVLNAAQALGQVPLRFDTWQADFLAAPSHKWMMAGYGLGLLCIHPKWRERPLPFAGWLSVPLEGLWNPFYGAQKVATTAGFEAQGIDTRRDASSLETGGGAFIQIMAMQAALDLHETIGIDTTHAHNLQLQRRLREGLHSRGFVANAPDDAQTLSGICGIQVEGGADSAVQRLLKEAQVVTTARQGVLRVATHVFNHETDIDTLLWAIDRLGLRP